MLAPHSEASRASSRRTTSPAVGLFFRLCAVQSHTSCCSSFGEPSIRGRRAASACSDVRTCQGQQEAGRRSGGYSRVDHARQEPGSKAHPTLPVLVQAPCKLPPRNKPAPRPTLARMIMGAGIAWYGSLPVHMMWTACTAAREHRHISRQQWDAHRHKLHQRLAAQRTGEGALCCGVQAGQPAGHAGGGRRQRRLTDDAQRIDVQGGRDIIKQKQLRAHVAAWRGGAGYGRAGWEVRHLRSAAAEPCMPWCTDARAPVAACTAAQQKMLPT